MADWPCRAALVLLAGICLAANAGADPTLPLETPKPIARPSAQKQIDAMKKRMNQLQLQINTKTAAANCIRQGIYVTQDPDTGDLQYGQPGDDIIPVLDPTCATP